MLYVVSLEFYTLWSKVKRPTKFRPSFSIFSQKASHKTIKQYALCIDSIDLRSTVSTPTATAILSPRRLSPPSNCHGSLYISIYVESIPSKIIYIYILYTFLSWSCNSRPSQPLFCGSRKGFSPTPFRCRHLRFQWDWWNTYLELHMSFPSFAPPSSSWQTFQTSSLATSSSAFTPQAAAHTNGMIGYDRLESQEPTEGSGEVFVFGNRFVFAWLFKGQSRTVVYTLCMNWGQPLTTTLLT